LVDNNAKAYKTLCNLIFQYLAADKCNLSVLGIVVHMIAIDGFKTVYYFIYSNTNTLEIGVFS
jgi:hypothetical protein